MSADIYLVQLEQIPPDPKLITENILTTLDTTGKSSSISFLVWCDRFVDDSSENKEAQKQLCKIFEDRFKSFQSEDQCRKFINENGDYYFVIIVSGQIGRDLVPKVHTLNQVKSVYIYCMNKEANEQWAKNYQKVKVVVTQLNDLFKEIQKIAPEHNSDDDTEEEFNQLKTPFYEYKDYPLTTLEKALEPCYSIIPELEKYVHAAKQQGLGSNIGGLTVDESAAISLYTMEFDGPEESFLQLLNEDLRSRQREKIKKWFFYLKLFLTALHKLPNERRTVWLGLNADVSKYYYKGKKGVFWGVTSTTMSLSQLQPHLSIGVSKNGRTLFSIECKRGKNVRDYSYFPNEDEIILLPGFCYEVIDVAESSPDLHMIYIKEINA